MEDDGVSTPASTTLYLSLDASYQIRAHMVQMLDRRSKNLKDIAKTLRVYLENVDDEPTNVEDNAPSRREILQGLITFVEGC
jgi:beta-catenin-like protein 1